MTKDEALDLAREALEPVSTFGRWGSRDVDTAKAQKALAAIKQARALDKKAENARELGLDYEPAEVLGHNGWGFPIKAAAPVQEDWGPGPHEYHSLTAAPVQEPVAWRYRGIFHEFDPSDWAEGPVTPLYTTPPAAQRKWVGLTDEELKAVTRLEGANSRAQLDLGKAFWAGARWAEAQLKEKNT